MKPTVKINIAELTKTTQAAIKAGSAAALMEAERQRLAAAAKSDLEATKANGILAQVPHRVKQEASAGRNHANIMGVKWSDWQGGDSGNVLKGNQLIGAAKLVWNALVDAKLSPTLEFWHDGMGMNSGYNIIVHWPKS